MNLETFQIPAFITVILALSSLIVIPVAAVALSKLPVMAFAKDSGSPEGAACNLPPTVELPGKTSGVKDDGLPTIDKRKTGDIRTATFAMG